ncbi:MAG: FAD-dependent oxidoreductase, partial [Desulfocapsaceae bacterium]|nr:FAD-dependent oxidoreductase [Desulfocapsaceae bacterium]
MTENISVDIAVLGGGPGGYTAAFRAADLGLSVCLIEQSDRLGGVCLNVGCIPSKTLLHAATIIEEAAEADDFGISFGKPEIDINALKAKKEQIITQLTGGLGTLCKKRGITRIIGRGEFSGETLITVDGGDEHYEITFQHAVIATGSQPFQLPGAPDDPRIWDSTDALTLDTIPERLLIIGGGIIGLEMAQVYSALGSQITIVEMESQLIPPADKDVVQPLFLKLKKKYQIQLNSRVSQISATPEAIEVTCEHGEESTTTPYDAVLVAVGRKPNTQGIGLEKLKITLSDRGFVEVDEQMRTHLSHIFAIGDAAGEPMLAHKATHQGKVAAEVAAGQASAFSPLTIPSVAYTNPE